MTVHPSDIGSGEDLFRDTRPRPRFKSHLHAEVVRQGVVVAGEGVERLFRGETIRRLAPLLDGTRSERMLLAETAGWLGPPELFHMLHLLKAADVLAEGPLPQAAAGRFWEAVAGLQPPSARLRLEVLDEAGSAGAGPPLPAMLAAALVREGARVAMPGDAAPPSGTEMSSAVADPAHAADAPELTLLLTPDVRAAGMAAFHRRALASGRRWMPLRLAGERLWIGPVFSPGTACWRCLDHRLGLNRAAETFLSKSGRRRVAEAVPPCFPALAGIAVAMAAKEVLQGLADPARFRDRFITYDPVARESGWHPVIRRPQCPDCGDPERRRAPRSVVMGHAPKPAGGHRLRPAAEVVEALSPLVDPLSGVVQSLALSSQDVPGQLYGVSARHSFRIGHDSLEWLERGLATRTGGKGASRMAATAGALGEAIERVSAVWTGEAKVLRASFAALGERALDPSTLVHFSDTQVRGRQAWNAAQTGSRFHAVPNPFDPGTEIDWTPVWSLGDEDFRYVPASLCHFGHPDSSAHYFFSGDTNGCAAGSGIEEAFVAAFHELVERDGVALWWYNRATRPGVDIESFELPAWRRTTAHHRALGRHVWALDLTSDLGVPTFAALSARDRGARDAGEDIVFGFAAHLDPRAALQGALAELGQFLPAVSRRGADGDGPYVWPEPDAHLFWRTVTRANAPYLVPSPGVRARRLEDFENRASDDLGRDAAILAELARRAGLGTYALDLTQPDVPLSVCRVIVPGLRHFWRQLGPGRLYDVPVRLGWVEAPTREADLNPHSIFV